MDAFQNLIKTKAMFQTGKKVICISDFRPCNCGCGKVPPVKKGKIYLVLDIRRDLKQDTNPHGNTNYKGLFLKIDGFPDFWLGAASFRPIEEDFAESVLENIQEKILEAEGQCV